MESKDYFRDKDFATMKTATIEIIEDLIQAAHNDSRQKIQSRTSEELSKITGGVTLPPGFKFPF